MQFNLYEFYRQLEGKRVLLTFKGALSQRILVKMGDYIRNQLSFDKKIKKIFSVFVELSQNIIRYSADREKIDGDPTGVGMILFVEGNEHYYILSGNSVRNETIPGLKNRLESINGMDKKELKDYYRVVISEDREPGQVGAGLGLIDIARKSENKMEYEFSDINEDKSFFTLTVKFEKGEQS